SSGSTPTRRSIPDRAAPSPSPTAGSPSGPSCCEGRAGAAGPGWGEEAALGPSHHALRRLRARTTPARASMPNAENERCELCSVLPAASQLQPPLVLAMCGAPAPVPEPPVLKPPTPVSEPPVPEPPLPKTVPELELVVPELEAPELELVVPELEAPELVLELDEPLAAQTLLVQVSFAPQEPQNSVPPQLL